MVEFSLSTRKSFYGVRTNGFNGALVYINARTNMRERKQPGLGAGIGQRQSRYKSGEFFGIPSVGAALKFAGVFETGLGDTGESLPLPAIIVWLPPTRDAAQFPVREAEKLEIPDKSGHLSVEPEGFCHFLSGLCLVLSQECPGFVRFCHPGKAEKQARRFWVRKFFRCHFVSFLPGARLRRETSGQASPTQANPNCK